MWGISFPEGLGRWAAVLAAIMLDFCMEAERLSVSQRRIWV
jgi:hypothetical protein